MPRKNLPEDVIVEILLRLPFKPLFRFRCVSKHWRSLISDPHFAKSHFFRASEKTQRLLFHTPSGLGSLEVDASFGDGSALRELVVPIKRQDRRVSIVGSCNGLVCVGFFVDIEFYVWNPSTGDRRKLPDPGFSVPQPENEYMRGFGYDSSTDDYKLFLWPFVFDPPPLGVEGKVYSLKKNSWKSIQSLDNRYAPYLTTGVLVNSALHWIVDLFPLEQSEFRIVALDLAEEKFREVPLPKDEDVIVSDILSNLGGRLCVNVDRPNHIELWGMLEYGVQESWAPLFTVGISLFSNFLKTGGDQLRIHCCNTPLCFSRSDQLVVLGCGDELRRYNSKKEIIEKTGIAGPYRSEAAVFVESLLSPNDYDCHGASRDEK